MSRAEALKAAGDRLTAAGVESPRLDAEVLLASALGCTRIDLFAEPARELAAPERERFDAMVARRLSREPVAQILGAKEFWGLEFKVSNATLTPRPDSETLVGAVLEAVDRSERGRDHAWSILDLGTGSGCLLLAVLSELPLATGLGVDVSATALEMAHENARRLGLGRRCRFIECDWRDGLGALGERFELVIANPPYIAAAELAALAPEVTDHEPRLALDGGDGGMVAYEAILARAGDITGPGAWLFFEVGAGQAAKVEALISEAGLVACGRRRDLAGHDRVVIARAGG